MYKFDEGPHYCMKCKKNVIKPCFFLLETDECLRLQEALSDASLKSKADGEQDE
jgi:hypothetical protein